MSKSHWEMCDLMFREEGKPPRSDIEEMMNKVYEGMLDWEENLPACLRISEDSVPELLSFHMQYHGRIMTAFSFLKTPAEADLDSKAKASVALARQRCLSSAQAVSRLVSFLRKRWGPQRESSVDMQFIFLGLFMLIDDLSTPESHATFVSLATAAFSLAGRWLLMKGMFRQVQITTMHTVGEPLSPEILRLFKRFERRLGRNEDRKHFNSAYPNFAAVLRQQDPDGSERADLDLDGFLDTWSNFTIGDTGDSSASERDA
ncbi:hypothetical protein BJX64DRAFT_295323 [Aspergillus heterothallicus]